MNEPQLHAHDGYWARCVDSESEGTIEVRFYLRLNGELVFDQPVRRWAPSNPRTRAEAEREHWFWLALAHYLNAGGEFKQLLWLLQGIGADCQSIQFPPGFSLEQTTPNEEDPRFFEHLFDTGHCRYLVWVEQLDSRYVDKTEYVNEYRDLED